MRMLGGSDKPGMNNLGVLNQLRFQGRDADAAIGGVEVRRLRERIVRTQPLEFILDELGYLPFAQTGSQLLFHLISRLYERTFRHQHHHSGLWRLAQRGEPVSGRALHGGAHHRPG